MACYYIIKLPNGGEVRIPATISTITEKNTPKIYKELKVLVDKYYKEETDKGIDAIKDFLKDSGFKVKNIKKILDASDTNSFIDNLNDKILGMGSNDNLADSLRKSLWDSSKKLEYTPAEGKTTNINLSTLLNKLNFKVSKKYFEGIKTDNILNTKNITDINTDLDISIAELEAIGANSSIINSLQNILNSAFQFNGKVNNIFYNINFDTEVNDAVVVFPEESSNPIIFYNGVSDMSLFIGAFKYMASNLDQEKVKAILEKHNKKVIEVHSVKLDKKFDVKKFFTGHFENGEFVDPEVNKLFRFRETMFEIVELIVDSVDKNPKGKEILLKDFKNLIKFVDPVEYGKEISAKQKVLIETYNGEQRLNKQLTNEIKGRAILPMIESESRNFYYFRPIKKTDISNVTELYSYLENNVSKGRDLLNVSIIKRDKSSFTMAIVPTEFHLVSNGVRVVGFHEKNGKLIWEKGGLILSNNKDFSISYRQLSDEIPIIYTDDAEEIPLSESIMIVAPTDEFLPKELVMNSVVRGSKIIYKPAKVIAGKENNVISNIVKGVYPGELRGNSIVSKGSSRDPYLGEERVIALKTERSLFEDPFTESSDKAKILAELDMVYPTKDFVPVSKGDYIKSAFKEKGKDIFYHNKVVAVTDKDVYILIKTKTENYSIKAIPKSDIKAIYKEKVNFDLNSIITIGGLHKKVLSDESISSDDFSYTNSYEAAKNGDYLVNEEANNTYTIYKVTNKENREGIKLDVVRNMIIAQKYVQIPQELNKFMVVTNRSIYSEQAIDTAELNNVFLTTEAKKDGKDYLKVNYYIPKEASIKNLIVLGSGNAITGMYKVEGTEKEIPENYKDVTNELVQYLNQTRAVKGDGLYVKAMGNYYIRYDASLYKVDFTPEHEKYLKKHTFVVFKNPKNSSKGSTKKYRIIGRSDNELLLEYSVFNKEGKLISIQKRLNLSNSEDLDQIKWFYVMQGSDAHKELSDVERQKKSSKSSKSKEQLEIDRKELILSVSETFKKIFNIEVQVISKTEKEFINKKAWIETTVGGTPKIVININNVNTNTEDLVHEYLHLFLMALKYNATLESQNLYEKVLYDYKETFSGKSDPKEQEKIDFINSSNNWTKIEEYFVEDVSKVINSIGVESLIDYESFLAAFKKSIENLGLSSVAYDGSSVFSLLNSKMGDIFTKSKKKVLANEGLILFDANFREWLSKQIDDSEIEVIC